MFRNYIFFLCALFVGLSVSAHVFVDETLDYKVDYKWGIVNKTAGRVTMTLKRQPDNYITRLTARTDPWADKLYMVRDTLNGRMSVDGLVPSFYEKISHEGSDHKHDCVRYRRTGAKTIGDCTRKVWKNDELKTDEKRTLESTGTTVDMLTAFYYMRSLPYEKWEKNHVLTINIFSGKRKELLTIKYLGREKVKYDDRTYECYHITFIFTADGRTKTSDDMDAWITTDSRRIPVKLEGKLAVGKVRCFYTGK